MTDESGSPTEPSFVKLMTASSIFEARLIVAVLQDAGIPAYRTGGSLVDEFAMSQRLMNLQGVDVHVPSDRLAEAEAALAASRKDSAATGESLDALAEAAASDPDAEVPPTPRRGGCAVACMQLVLATLVGWLASGLVRP